MRRILVATLCLLVVVGGLPLAVADATVLAPAEETPETKSKADPAATGPAEPATVGPPNESSNRSNQSMGAAFSTFTQSTATEAESSVDSGMWGAAWRSSADNETRAALIEGRARVLEQRVATLQQQLNRLEDRQGQMNPVAYRAQLASLTSRLAAIGEALNQTESAAVESDVNTSALDDIRTNASQLSGPAVAEMARELGGNDDVEDVPGVGPPDDGDRGNGNDECQNPNQDDCERGGNGQSDDNVNESTGGDNSSLGTPGNGTGNVTDGDGPGTGTGNGPDDDGTGNGPGDDGTGTDDDGTGGAPTDDVASVAVERFVGLPR